MNQLLFLVDFIHGLEGIELRILTQRSNDALISYVLVNAREVKNQNNSNIHVSVNTPEARIKIISIPISDK